MPISLPARQFFCYIANLAKTTIKEVFDALSILPTPPSTPLPATTTLVVDPSFEVNLTKLAPNLVPHSSWVMDSGNTHMTRQSSSVSNFVPIATFSKVHIACGLALDIKGKGAIHFDENKK